MYFKTISQMKKGLLHIDAWLDTAEAFAKSRGYEPNLFLDVRFAPDQFPLVRQVRIACDTVKLAASRLAGREAPSHADTETTLAELHARIQSVVTYLNGFTEKDFDGAADRVISTPRWEGKVMSGADYFAEHAVPNFYFHMSHTYALLRSNGVSIGKKDYLGALTQR